MVLAPKRRRSTRFQLDLVHSFAFCWHSSQFKDISKLSNQLLPAGGFWFEPRALPCTSTRVSLHGDHVASWLNQHKQSITSTSHVPFNLLNTAQLNTCDSLGGQCMEHMSARIPIASHSNCTSLPIDDWIGRLQPINTQHDIMV